MNLKAVFNHKDELPREATTTGFDCNEKQELSYYYF